MTSQLEQILRTRQLGGPQRTQTLAEVDRLLLEHAHSLDVANFTRVHPDDLALAFALYDRLFFDQQLSVALGGRSLTFNFSRRMTSIGGHTVQYRGRGGGPDRYEIALSATLLFNNFHAGDPPVIVNGLACTHRLHAMLRVFEHELVHLAEMLTWDRSSCSARRFQGIAERLFGHREHKHRLVTPSERAATKFGVRTGDEVTFRFEGRQYLGRVNRINRRATILVEDAAGPQYSDGKRYRKFYVPISLLEKRDPS